MGTDDRRPDLGTDREHWIAGIVVGLFAGFVFGAIMSHTPMMDNVAALLNLGEAWHGWLVHFGFSAIFGLGYVGIAAAAPSLADRPSTGAVTGVSYGIVVWVLGAAIVMPLWLGAVQPVDPPVPNWNWLSFAGHIAFGVTLGAFYPVVVAHETP
ncbi:MAG: histidine kinase [Halobacteriota archaeon]